MTKICEAFGRNIEKHISVYGAHNEQRLTGLHETQSIHEFSYGVSDRGASIRIPVTTRKTDGLEDWKTADQHLMATHTRLLQRSSPLQSRLTDLIQLFLGAHA